MAGLIPGILIEGNLIKLEKDSLVFNADGEKITLEKKNYFVVLEADGFSVKAEEINPISLRTKGTVIDFREFGSGDCVHDLKPLRTLKKRVEWDEIKEMKS